MKRVDLDLLKITLEDVAAALARESRPRNRKRIHAIRLILEGKTVPQAANAVRVSETSVRRYLKLVREYGPSALVYDGYDQRRRNPLALSEIPTLRAGIAGALAREPTWRARKRLLAVDKVLAGEPIPGVAAEEGVTPNVVRTWLGLARNYGVGALIEAPRIRGKEARLAALRARTGNQSPSEIHLGDAPR
jgi:Winged helix-turn helix